MHEKHRQYRYTLELYRNKPVEHLGSLPIEPDWEPVLEWARFESLRGRRAEPIVFGTEGTWIEPHWSALLGSPYVEALKAVVPWDNGDRDEFDVPLSHFAAAARAASIELVRDGTLARGELFQYLVCAYAPAEEPSPAPAGRFSVRPVAEVMPVVEQPIDERLATSAPSGTPSEDCMPVFVPRTVLDETVKLMQRAGKKETGGILLGHLQRDARSGELFLEVTAQVPARHAVEELDSLTFTPETWAAADAARSLRNRGEVYVGWWHTHPAHAWCDDCPPAVRKRCPQGTATGDFFSTQDVALQRAVFPRAYSVALVLSTGCRSPESVHWNLFGWDRGRMAARGFHILDADANTVPVGSRTLE